MNFQKVVDEIISKLDEAGIRYALIGGFAMALRGVHRATVDLDFILMLQDMNKADEIFQNAGYRRAFRSENVSHYKGTEDWLGRIDILHAFRGPTLSMLDRADRIPLTVNGAIPVVQVEDLIGLKVQAACNDPLRHTSDWSDIRMLVEGSAATDRPLDWELIGDYLAIFGLEAKLEEIQNWYDSIDRSRQEGL